MKYNNLQYCLFECLHVCCIMFYCSAVVVVLCSCSFVVFFLFSVSLLLAFPSAFYSNKYTH